MSPDQERQILQRVRSQNPPGADDLYFRRDQAANGALTISTGAYMNIFHQKNWRRLTKLADFRLEVRDSAAGRFDLLSSGPEREPLTVASRRLSGSGERLVFHLPAEADFCWFDWTPDDSQGELPEAFYASEALSSRPEVSLALVVTTFERADDLRRLVETYEGTRRENREIETSTGLYIVNNQPHDVQALADLARPGVVLFHNPVNNGGAGGFSRGAREVVAAGGHSHIVFMDDDILIDPEAWFRTLALLRNLAPDYAGQILAGAMFLRERPTYCHTMGEAFDKFGLYHNTTGPVDLGGLRETLTLLSSLDPDAGFPGLEHIPSSAGLRPYAAWWYCAIPVSHFKSRGFPLPLLFKGDDMEYSFRLNRKILYLNGICVWHPDFKGKGSDLRNYLEVRNHAIWVTLHFRRWRLALMMIFAYRLAKFLAANDYSSTAIVIQALADYRCFHERREDSVPETAAKLRNCRSRFPNDLAAAAKVGEPLLIPSLPRSRTLDALSVLAALGGSLIPARFFRISPLQAPLTQVKGKFPARYVASPDSSEIKIFNRRRAFILSLKGLAALAGFLFPVSFSRKLKNFAATYGGYQ